MAFSHQDATDANDYQIVAQGTNPWAVSIDVATGKPTVDAFGRNRVCIPSLITSLHFANTTHDLYMNSSASGTGAVSHNAATSSIRLTTGGTASGASIVRQTKRYVKYNPGLSYIYTIAANVGAKKTNVRKRWGVYDALNGYFFEQDGSNLKIVTRTNASGSAVDTAVNQSSWNLDKLDGTGASGITLDESKHQLWVIDYIWHGAGPVRFGVHIGGRIIYVHQVLAGNTLASPFTRTAINPIRFEIENTGTAASATTMDVVCITSASEDGGNRLVPAYQFSASNGQTAKSVSTSLIPIISIRPKLTLNSLVNRAPIVPISFEVLTAAPYLDYYLVINPTLTGSSFVSVGANSCVEYDTSATAYSGGTVVYSGYTTNAAKGGGGIADVEDLVLLGLDIAGATADILTIVARANNNNNSTYAAIRWDEFQ